MTEYAQAIFCSSLLLIGGALAKGINNAGGVVITLATITAAATGGLAALTGRGDVAKSAAAGGGVGAAFGIVIAVLDAIFF